MISKQTIDKIFSTISVEEIVGEYVQLKRAGSNYKDSVRFMKKNLQVLSFRQVNRSGKISQQEKEEQRSLS
jgi:DNA primase